MAFKKGYSKKNIGKTCLGESVGASLGTFEMCDGLGWYPLATQDFVNSKVFDINSNTSGNLNISRLSGYPSSSSVFLRGDGVWASIGGGTGTVTSITAGTGLSGGTITTSGTIGISNTGVTAGTYTWPSAFTVNAQGQLSSVTSGGSLPINRLQSYPGITTAFLRGDGSWTNTLLGDLNLLGSLSNTTLLISSGSSTSTFIGCSVLDYNNYNMTVGLRVVEREAALIGSSNVGAAIYTNSTARMRVYTSGLIDLLGNSLQTTGTIKTNNLAVQNSSSVMVLSPLFFSGISVNPITVTTNNSKNYLVLNNTYASATGTGLIVQNNGADQAEFGFNNSTNEAYVWAYGTATLKFGTASTKRMEILNNGNIKMRDYNWFTQNSTTQTGTIVYGLDSNGFIIENYNGESAGIGFSGVNDQCTIWTAGDNGTFLNIQDEDVSNSRVAYVATTGTWTVVSSAKRKTSIRVKANNNVLGRFMQLSVKTYGYKYPVETGFSEQKIQRIKKKSKKMSTGLILEEVFNIFPNCIPEYYNPLFAKKRNKKPVLEDEIKDVSNCGISYDVILCYFIMAFQEYVTKTDEVLLALKEKLSIN